MGTLQWIPLISTLSFGVSIISIAYCLAVFIT